MTNISQKKINYNLEIIRGVAAIVVVIHHVIYHNIYFDPKYFPKALKAFDPPGHLAVLIFFILSGYVIGISHKNRLKGKEIFTYLKKRFLRIYPIYFLAIIIGLLVATNSYSVATVASNFSLTQNIWYPVIWENNPAWSLNYEVLYYLLFIPVSYFQIKPLLAIIIFFIIGTINLYFPVNPIITAYSYGYCFWLSGMYLASSFKDVKENTVKILPLIFYFLAIENIVGGSYVYRLFLLIKQPPLISTNIWAQNIIGGDDLIYLPYCFMIILFLAGKDIAYKKVIFLLMQLFPLFVIYSQFKHHTQDAAHFYVGVGYLVLACVTYLIHINEELIKNIGVKLGSISYGMYIIHFPILFLLGRIPMFADGLWAYIMRFILYFIITLASAWLLDKKLQPVFKRLFTRN